MITNWSPAGVPANSAPLSFGGSGSTSYTSTNNIVGYILGAVSLTSTASVTDIIAGNQFTISGTSISQDNTGAFDIQNTFTNTAGTTLTLTGNGTGVATLSGVISEFNAGSKNVSLTKTGTSTFVLSAANTFTGPTTISGGTLKLDNNNATTARLASTNITLNSGGTLLLAQTGVASTNRIVDTATVTLNGGKIDTGGLSEGTSAPAGIGVGALTLQANSIIDLGAGASILHFAASNVATWTASKILEIDNWSGSTSGGGVDELIFGNSSSGLTASQIAEIEFLNPSGFSPGTYGAAILASGEIVPIPEPGSWAAAALAFAGLALSHRRRIRSVTPRWTSSGSCTT